MIRQYVKNFNVFRPLLGELVARDVKVKYRKSVLGILWTVLNPLLMMTVLTVVFSNLFRFDVENYPVYILCGQVVFNFFNDTTTGSLTSIIGNAALIRKVYVPKYLFVLSRVSFGIINLMSALCALIIVMIVTRAELHYTVFLVWIPLGILAVFSLGVSLFLSAAVAKFRDIMQFCGSFFRCFSKNDLPGVGHLIFQNLRQGNAHGAGKTN